MKPTLQSRGMTMTDKKIDLALAFLQTHAPSAAEILEQQPVEEVAAFLHDVPHAYAAPVLEQMLPQYTARLCRHIEPSIAAGFLSLMDISMATVVLRHMNEDVREALLDHLPEKTLIACKLLLNYAEDQVGAWMNVHIASLPDNITVSSALQRLAAEKDVEESDAIYVVDREGTLQGLIFISRLLRNAPDTPITALMQKNPDVISGRTSLMSALNHIGWTSVDMLPVINRNHRLVGAIRHVDLRKGIEQVVTTIEGPHGNDPLSAIFEVYGSSWLTLFSTVGELMGVERKHGESQ